MISKIIQTQVSVSCFPSGQGPAIRDAWAFILTLLQIIHAHAAQCRVIDLFIGKLRGTERLVSSAVWIQTTGSMQMEDKRTTEVKINDQEAKKGKNILKNRRTKDPRISRRFQ